MRGLGPHTLATGKPKLEISGDSLYFDFGYHNPHGSCIPWKELGKATCYDEFIINGEFICED